MYLVLLTCLLIASLWENSSSEWVEIAQQHYRRKPEDFFETSTRTTNLHDRTSFLNQGTTKLSDFNNKNTDIDVSVPFRSVNNKGLVHKITKVSSNCGSIKGTRETVNQEQSDELDFATGVSSEQNRTPISNYGPKGVKLETNVETRPNQNINKKIGSPHSLNPNENRPVWLTDKKPTNKFKGEIEIDSEENFSHKNNIGSKKNTYFLTKDQIHDPKESGQRYESYEIKEDFNNKYTANTKGNYLKGTVNIKKITKDEIEIHNLEEIVPKITTPNPFKHVSLADTFVMQTEKTPYIDIIHDLDVIPIRRADINDETKDNIEADEIADVKLIVGKPNRRKTELNNRKSVKNKNHQQTDARDRIPIKELYIGDNEDSNIQQETSSEIINDKIPFVNADVTKIIEPPDPGFVTKHEIIEEGFIIDDKEPYKDVDEASVSIEEPETYTDDIPASTEKLDDSNIKPEGSATYLNNSNKNPMEGVIKVVKFVTATIANNTRKGFRSKLNYLNRLKNSLMSNIVSRIDALWPDDDSRSTRKSRQARSHVEFPSSEGALMSISFLTFAVFLIKLVMQLIQTFRQNSASTFYAPAAVVVSRAASAMDKRSAPGAD